MDQSTVIGVLIVVALAGFLAFMLIRRHKIRHTQDPTTSRFQAIVDSLTVRIPPVPGSMPSILSRRQPEPQVLAGISEAFRERIATAQSKGWTDGLEPANYTVLIFPSLRNYNSDNVYSPVFQVFFGPGEPYDESIYDQEPGKPGGWTYAAEQVLVDQGNPTNIFVIADNDNLEYTTRVTSYGLDHIIAARNDRALYEATKDHSQGGGHPLW